MTILAIRNCIVAVCGAWLIGGCAGDSGGVTGDGAYAGRMRLERVGRGGRRLVDAPARATWCEADSSVVIVAVDREWNGGIALRVRWPLAAPRVFEVRHGLEGMGSAAAALRSLADSVGPALMGASGTVRMDADAKPTGRFDVIAEGADGSPVRITGSFRAVPIVEGCSSTQRSP